MNPHFKFALLYCLSIKNAKVAIKKTKAVCNKQIDFYLQFILGQVNIILIVFICITPNFIYHKGVWISSINHLYDGKIYVRRFAIKKCCDSLIFLLINLSVQKNSQRHLRDTRVLKHAWNGHFVWSIVRLWLRHLRFESLYLCHIRIGVSIQRKKPLFQGLFCYLEVWFLFFNS